MTHKRVAWIALIVLAVALPFFFSPYRVSQFTLVLAYAVAALGLNLLLGYSGQISLGHGAFFALGAYTTAILVAKSGWPHLATIPVAAAICFAAGFAVGIPALRLHGLYLALVTLGLAVATPQLIKRFDGLTGGTQGLSAPPPAAPGWASFLADDQWLYLLNLAIAVPMFVLAAGIVRGRVGRALVAVRDNQIAAKTFGVDLAAYKTRAFAISAAYAGVGGSMFAMAIGFVAPESFGVRAVVLVPRRGRRRRPGDRGRSDLRGAVHRVRAGLRLGRQRGARGRDLRRRPDPVHVRAADGSGRPAAPPRRADPADGGRRRACGGCRW